MSDITLINKRLQEGNLSRCQLAKMTGIAAPDIYNCLNGNRPLYPGWRKKIFDVLGLTEEVEHGTDE